MDLRPHLKLSSSGVSLPCTGAACLKEEASTYFSFELSSSSCSGAASTSRILFCVSIGKRWRGILSVNYIVEEKFSFKFTCDRFQDFFFRGKTIPLQTDCREGRSSSLSRPGILISEQKMMVRALIGIISPVCLVSDPHR